MPPLTAPPDPSGPFFVYGLLQPGELAFSLVQRFVTRQDRASATGTLWLRDGLPLFDPDGRDRVLGHLLWFTPDTADEAWTVVSSFEPAAQYKWAAVEADAHDEHGIVANVLAGRRLRSGTAAEPVAEWSAQFDPVFVEGLDEVRHLVLETAPIGIDVQPDRPELWQQFFRLQAAYLLLWSIIERYTALRFGPALDPGARIKRLGEDVLLREAVVEAGAEPDVVVDTRDPNDRIQLARDGTGAVAYFYRVRSNLSHRGKSAFQDARLLFKALVELHDTMRIVLSRQLPTLEVAWRQALENDVTPLLRPLLPEDATSRAR